jgi:hypothetical protein
MSEKSVIVYLIIIQDLQAFMRVCYKDDCILNSKINATVHNLQYFCKMLEYPNEYRRESGEHHGACINGVQLIINRTPFSE